MKIKEIYSKLYEFVVSATGLPKEKVIFANQTSMVRPTKPFVTISAGSFKNIGTPIEKKVNAAGEVSTLIAMVFTASFQSYSDRPHEAEEILSDLYAGIFTELQPSIFKGVIAAGKTIRHVAAIPLPVNNQMESRAILEIEFGFNKITKYKAGLIEKISLKGIVDNKEITA